MQHVILLSGRIERLPALLAELSRTEVEQGLEAAGLVFVAGGNVFHLLHHAIKSGFADLVPPLVRAGKLTYAGVSAGALLAGPDLFPVSLAATLAQRDGSRGT
jgi:peptidase E